MAIYTSDTDTIVDIYQSALADVSIGFASRYKNQVHPGSNKKISGWQWDRTVWPSSLTLESLTFVPMIFDPLSEGVDDDYWQSGIGSRNDLKLEGIAEAVYDPDILSFNTSNPNVKWMPQVRHGYFYDKDKEYYCHSEDVVIQEVYNNQLVSGVQYANLKYKPKPGIPVVVRRYAYDKVKNTYVADIDFEKKVDFSGTLLASGVQASTREANDNISYHNIDTAKYEFVVDYEDQKVYLNNDYAEDIAVSGDYPNYELVGISDGWQREYYLDYSPVDISGMCHLVISQNGGSYATWHRIDREDAYIQDSGIYRLDPILGRVIFGDQSSEDGSYITSEFHGPEAWIERRNPKASHLYGITYGNDLFVAVGAADGTDAYILTSPDGITWTERSNAKTKYLTGITYGNDLFVAVGEADGVDAYIVTSLNGINWSERSNPKNFLLMSVTYGNGLFVAVGAADGTDAYIITSPDGITWTERSNPKNAQLRGLAYANGLFVAVGVSDGTDAYILTSPDGITWTESSNPKNTDLSGVTYGNGLFVAVGWADGVDGYLLTSPNGINWTERSNPKSYTLYEVTYGNGLFVAVGYDGGSDTYIIDSFDGINWTEKGNPKDQYLLGITYGDNLFVAVGYTDGIDAYILTSEYIGETESESITHSGLIPSKGSRIYAAYTKSVAIEYEPEFSRDLVHALDSDLNPLKNAFEKGFITVSSQLETPASITLTSSLDTEISAYLYETTVRGSSSYVIATVLSNLGNPLPNQEVVFEIADGYGTFNNGLQTITAVTDINGEARALYSPPLTLEDISKATDAITFSGAGFLIANVADIQEPLTMDDVTSYWVYRDDNVFGYPASGIDEFYYRPYLAEEFGIEEIDVTSSGITEEILRRETFGLGAPLTYDDTLLENLGYGRHEILIGSGDDAIHPHYGDQFTPSTVRNTLMEAKPLRCTALSDNLYELVYSGVSYITWPTPEAITRMFTTVDPTWNKAISVTVEPYDNIQSYIRNPNTFYSEVPSDEFFRGRLYSNDINIRLAIPEEGEGTLYIEDIADVADSLISESKATDFFLTESRPLNASDIAAYHVLYSGQHDKEALIQRKKIMTLDAPTYDNYIYFNGSTFDGLPVGSPYSLTDLGTRSLAGTLIGDQVADDTFKNEQVFFFANESKYLDVPDIYSYLPMDKGVFAFSYKAPSIGWMGDDNTRSYLMRILYADQLATRPTGISYYLSTQDRVEQTNPKNFTLYGITYGNGLFVAVGGADGADAYIVTSSDGITWTERSNPKNKTLYSVTYGNGLFVAVGNADGADAYIVTSPNGITWTERSNPKNYILLEVTYGNGLFVAVGQADGTDAYSVTSPDGITWTERANPKNFTLSGAIYGNGLFVAVGLADGSDAYIITSPDGINWTERSNPKNYYLAGVTYNNDLFVAVGNSDGTDAYMVTSSDGINWSERSNPKKKTLYKITYGNGLFVAVGEADGTDAYSVTSPDGINWTERSNPKNITLQNIVYANSQFVAVGNADGADAYLITFSNSEYNMIYTCSGLETIIPLTDNIELDQYTVNDGNWHRIINRWELERTSSISETQPSNQGTLTVASWIDGNLAYSGETIIHAYHYGIDHAVNTQFLGTVSSGSNHSALGCFDEIYLASGLYISPDDLISYQHEFYPESFEHWIDRARSADSYGWGMRQVTISGDLPAYIPVGFRLKDEDCELASMVDLNTYLDINSAELAYSGDQAYVVSGERNFFEIQDCNPYI